MSTIQDIKEQAKQAMRKKDETKRDILRLVIGLVQQDNDESDAAVQKVIKKLIKSNTETLESSNSDSDKNKLREENGILATFLPETMSEADIVNFIKEFDINLSSAKNEGQAMGMVIKALKSQKKEFEARDVKKVVQNLLYYEKT